MDKIRKIIREILFETWENMTAGAKIDTFGRGSSSHPLIPYNQRINDYEQLAFQKDLIRRNEAFDFYQWDGPKEINGKITYSIDTHKDTDKRNADFILDVEFFKPESDKLDVDKLEGIWEWTVKTAARENGLFKNRDRITNVLSTLNKIIESFVINNKPAMVLFRANKSTNPTEVNITNMFTDDIAQNIPSGYIFKDVNDVVYLIKKNTISAFDKLKELINPTANQTGRVNPDANGY